jgi:hypothetical protein
MTMDNTMTMLSQEETFKSRNCGEGQACGCRVIVDSDGGAVIPLYVSYAIYLYWTLPPSAYLATGN